MALLGQGRVLARSACWYEVARQGKGDIYKGMEVHGMFRSGCNVGLLQHGHLHVANAKAKDSGF